jgi:hypothetical protein
MALFKRAAVAGMAHELTRQGIVTWPSKLAEDEAADAIADNFSDEEVPEMTDQTGLTEEQAQAILQKILEVASLLKDETGGVADPEVGKVAASSEYGDVASATALRLMQKAAEETSVSTGPAIPGETPPKPENDATAEGKVDEMKTPSSALVGPQGTTSLDTKPGAVGTEEPQVTTPGAVGSAPTGEVAKLSSIMQTLAKRAAAMDGASLSGGSVTGPAPAGRLDLTDNIKIPGVVASSQGKTTQPEPANANVGIMMKQPAGTPGPTDATKNEVAKDAIKQAAQALTNLANYLS